MHKSEITKQQTVLQNTKIKVDGLDGKSTSINKNKDLKNGSCIVQHSVSFGTGSICDIEVLGSNRQSTGVFYYDATCHDSRLSVGNIVQFNKRSDGTVELVSGGGNQVQATANASSTYVPLHSHQGIYDGGYLNQFGGTA